MTMKHLLTLALTLVMLALTACSNDDGQVNTEYKDILMKVK